MNNYSFSTLNDKEFELLVKDLLNEKFSFGLQSFKIGKDKGIDLRYSTNKNNNSIIVQVKHYNGSKYSQLKHILVRDELNKILLLKPERYLIATSLNLSASQKDELKAGLQPFVLSSNDIISNEDLNSYLAEFPEIEKKYFKLWFSSLNIINTVLNNAIEGRTKYLLEKISTKIHFFVVTKKLDDANTILLREKLLLITGQPGIGKTTLAEILLFEKAKLGFKIFQVENIKEAEDVFSPNSTENQLFYFDDFLGANYSEIVNSHKTETQLTSFVERIRSTPNKYLILTTRTIILNFALEKYEKIHHSKIASKQFEIKLNDYSNYEKAQILYNHLYFRKIPNDLFKSILKDKFYRNIILHKNYTPRIIEFITDNTRIEKFTPPNYIQFISNNLTNPKEIWRYSFLNQIGYLDKCLLLTLFTFENGAFENELYSAFESRLEFEKNQHNQIINASQFHESIRILLNGFIVLNLYDSKNPLRQYKFINPSLTDFLISYVNESYQEKKSIISSIRYLEQLVRFNPENSIIQIEKELQLIIRDRIANSKLIISQEGSKELTENKKHAIYLEVLCRYCKNVNIDTLLLSHIKEINYEESWYNIVYKMEYFLLNLGDAPQTYNYIREKFFEIIAKITRTGYDPTVAEKIPILFELYKYNYDDYLEGDGFNEIIDLISRILEHEVEDCKFQYKDSVTELDVIENIYDDIESLERDLKNSLFPNSIIYHDFGIEMNRSYWKEVVNNNINQQERNELLSSSENFYKEKEFNFNEDFLIDDLFD